MRNHRYEGDASGYCVHCGAEQHEHVGHGGKLKRRKLSTFVVTAPATPRDDQVATFNAALDLIEQGCEPTSAFKEAAHRAGVPFGEEMGRFVKWARARYLTGV